jgi:hypothetical protein
MSASLSLEDHNEQQLPVVAVTPVIFAPAGPSIASSLFGVGLSNSTATGVSSAAGSKVPDVVANLRLDQAWGAAQIGGALHNVAGTYYTTGFPASSNGPSDKIGWAVGGGVLLNLPMLGAGDHMTVASNYCTGATRYCSNPSLTTGAGPGFGLRKGSTVAVGWFDDAYFNSASGDLELPTVWNIIGGLSHNWNAQWNTSLYGVYNNFKANSNAINTNVCANMTNDATGLAFGAGNNAGCTDFSSWQLGSRTTWHVVRNLDVSLEAMYTKANSAMQGHRFSNTTVQGAPATLVGGDADIFTGIFRVQSNFYP